MMRVHLSSSLGLDLDLSWDFCYSFLVDGILGAWMNFDVWIVFSYLGASWLASLLVVGYILLHINANLMLLFFYSVTCIHNEIFTILGLVLACVHCEIVELCFYIAYLYCMGHVCWTNSPRDNSMVEFILISHFTLQNKV